MNGIGKSMEERRMTAGIRSYPKPEILRMKVNHLLSKFHETGVVHDYCGSPRHLRDLEKILGNKANAYKNRLAGLLNKRGRVSQYGKAALLAETLIKP